MTRLEQLRESVAKMFENAQDKEQIDNGAKILAEIDLAKEEEKKLTEKYTELAKSYRELLIYGQSEKPKEEPKGEDTPAPRASLEDILRQYDEMKKKNNK